MMWSNESTGKYAFAPILACLALLGGGCASHKAIAPPPPLRGSVNLAQLALHHPGWSGVGQYDDALRRLEQAAATLPPPGQPDQKMATLPALPADALQNGMTAPALNAGGAGRRLDSVQQSLLRELKARREMAREDEVQRQRDVWRGEARQRFPVPIAAASTQPDLELQLLQANVETLTRTVNNWKPPTRAVPTPTLDQLKAKVAAEQVKLDALLAERAQQREIAAAQFRTAVQNSHEMRVAYVQAQADALESHLQADDARLVAAEAARLSGKRTALLRELTTPVSIGVPTAGFAGAETLPHGPGVAQATVSQASLAASKARLRAQRARWIKFLVDDTQAAALDVAGQKKWDITFGPPRPGDRDLTNALAQAMASSVWRL